MDCPEDGLVGVLGDGPAGGGKPTHWSAMFLKSTNQDDMQQRLTRRSCWLSIPGTGRGGGRVRNRFKARSVAVRSMRRRNGRRSHHAPAWRGQYPRFLIRRPCSAELRLTLLLLRGRWSLSRSR